MNILFAAQGSREDQSTTHRVLWPAEELDARGHSTTIVLGIKRDIAGHNLRFVNPKSISKIFLEDFDVVIMNRDASPIARTLQYIAKLQGTPFVFDFDDALYTRTNIVGTRIPNPTRYHFETILSDADYVTTGVERLTQVAKQYNPKVTTLTTPANTDVFSPDYSAPRTYDEPVIGWMGVGSGHVHNLNLLVDPLINLAKSGYDFRFRFISALSEQVRDDFQPVEEHIPVDYGFNSWVTISEIVSEMQTFDIGVCPLQMDDPYMEGKSPMKVLEMMATGIPVVASNAGAYSNVIDDHQTGCLANSSSEWQESLATLLDNPQKREKLAERGHIYTLENFTVSKHVDRLESILQNIS